MMHEFKVVPLQKKDKLIVRLKHDEIMDVSFSITYSERKWIWKCYAGIENWNVFVVQNKRFVIKKLLEVMPHNKQTILSKEKEISESFYELLRQLKQHPRYRLKVMNMLNDDIRTVWDNI